MTSEAKTGSPWCALLFYGSTEVQIFVDFIFLWTEAPFDKLGTSVYNELPSRYVIYIKRQHTLIFGGWLTHERSLHGRKAKLGVSPIPDGCLSRSTKPIPSNPSARGHYNSMSKLCKASIEVYFNKKIGPLALTWYFTWCMFPKCWTTPEGSQGQSEAILGLNLTGRRRL